MDAFFAAIGLDPNRLPAVNAALNATCAVLLVLAYAAIRARRIRLHQVLMIAAFVTSVIFLSSYLYFHIVVKGGKPSDWKLVVQSPGKFVETTVNFKLENIPLP